MVFCFEFDFIKYILEYLNDLLIMLGLDWIVFIIDFVIY